MDGWNDKQKSPCVLQDFVPFRPLPKNKGNMWSAIPVALLYMLVIKGDKQGSSPEMDNIL